MSDNPIEDIGNESNKNESFFSKRIAGSKAFLSTMKAHPIWGGFYVVIFLILTSYANIVYDLTKNYFLPQDEYLTTIRDEQIKHYQDLKNSLSELKGSIDSSESRSAYKSVTNYTAELFKSNIGFVNQLKLAKLENESLSKVAQQKSGVSGGYDFILSEGMSMRINNSTIVGLEYVSANRFVRVNITAASITNNEGRKTLHAGESVKYQNQVGKNCKITVLSINNKSASFGNNCI